jgi:hypothetical protein
VGGYRLLILDGHESHLNQDFKDYCMENKILTLCILPHSSHILQPLDVVCFSPCKRKYSQRVRDLARRRVLHINKEFSTFLQGQSVARLLKHQDLSLLMRRWCWIALKYGCVPHHYVQETPWQSKTPSNTHEFGSRSKLIRESFTRSPVTAVVAASLSL